MITKKEKVEVYERVLHDIQMYRSVAMDYDKLGELLDLICSWSYSHRSSDPMTDKRRRRMVSDAFRRLKKHVSPEV
jgi:nicotinamide mononucleotide adenylyltransferase